MGESNEYWVLSGDDAPSGAVWRQMGAEHMNIPPPPSAWKKVWRQQLHCSAVHEAGHLTVARRRGYWARARLYYPMNGGRQSSLRWSGQTMLQSNVLASDAVAIGLAGFMSEMVHFNGVSIADCPSVYAHATDNDFTSLSESDRAYIASVGGIDPFGLQRGIITEVAAEVANLRAEIRREAAILIKAAHTLRLG